MSVGVDAMKNRSQVLVGRFRFLRDTSAAVGLASVMLGGLVLVGAGALGDMVWLSQQQNMLKGAVNAAGLAAFKGMLNLDPNKTEDEKKEELKKIVKRYVLVNVPDAYRKAVEKSLTVKVKQKKTKSSDGNEKETVIVHVKAKRGGASPFIGLGKDDEISARIAAERAIVPVDVVLAYDVSAGSYNGRLEAIQNAGRVLISALYDRGGEHVSLGVVPYSGAAVNIGQGRSEWVDDIGKGHKTIPPPNPEALTPTIEYFLGLTPRPPGYAEWAGCVEHRMAPRDRSLDTHKVEKFPSYFYPWDYNYPDGPDGYANPWQHAGPQFGCPKNAIVPLTSDRSSILQKIAELTVFDAAGNIIGGAGGLVHLGVLWGRRVLAPSWQTVWGGVPQATAQERRKVLVVLTTGLRQPIWEEGYSAYGRSGKGPVDNGYVDGDPLDGVVRGPAVQNRLDGVTLDNCKRGRHEGIQIYGVFDGSARNRETTLDFLTECSKSAAGVFDSTKNADGLIGTFKEIGNKIGTVRLVRPPASGI